ncbi:lipoprotein-releasing ABC transporter permease subunit [uncultured Tolumonas sp.]|uniref:lipoprotein-releasing ABC transporter permease subunit n=1 Tax=uncultured Tolumonas sp. TaxID=263765 RepID=UPI002A0A2732|nr:lipoprotein-releasing ABC transporter permease subunit [uncultured Tolumonas sp.]
MKSLIFQPVSLAIGLRYAGARGDNRFASFISIFSTFGIAIGVLALIVVSSVMNGFEAQLKDRILGVVPHGVITTESGQLANWQQYQQTVMQLPHVQAAAPFITTEGMVQSPGSLAPIALQGLDPQNYPKQDLLRQTLGNAALQRLVAGKFNIILGGALAQKLGVMPGDQVRVLVSEGSRFTPMGRVPSQRLFHVVALFDVGSPVDDQIALIHLDDARRLLRYQPENITGWRVWLDDAFQTDDIAKTKLPSSLVFQDWRQERGELFRAVAMEKHIMSLMLVLIILVAAFNILSALVMVVLDKQGEVAILRTMGMQSQTVMKIFIVQGIWSGVLGGIFGMIGGVVLTHYLNPVLRILGLNLYMDAGGGGLPVELQISQVLLIAFGALLMSFMATLYPAYRAAHIRPAEALRYE